VQIALTQDLLELFIEYQIPSDLLTYDEGEGAAPERKLAAVSEHVAAIHSMLAKAKAEELRQAEEAKEMARLEAERELAERRAREEEMMECMEDLMEVGSCEMDDISMASNAVSFGGPPAPKNSKKTAKKKKAAKSAPDSAPPKQEQQKAADAAASPAPAPLDAAPPQQEQQKAADASASPAPAPLDATEVEAEAEAEADAEAEALDLTQLPTQLDKAFDALPGACLSPTRRLQAGQHTGQHTHSAQHQGQQNNSSERHRAGTALTLEERYAVPGEGRD
jgi:hypothetical protein